MEKEDIMELGKLRNVHKGLWKFLRGWNLCGRQIGRRGIWVEVDQYAWNLCNH